MENPYPKIETLHNLICEDCNRKFPSPFKQLRYCPSCKSENETKLNTMKPPKPLKTVDCIHCKEQIHTSQPKHRAYCSSKCSAEFNKLQNENLIKSKKEIYFSKVKITSRKNQARLIKDLTILGLELSLFSNPDDYHNFMLITDETIKLTDDRMEFDTFHKKVLSAGNIFKFCKAKRERKMDAIQPIKKPKKLNTVQSKPKVISPLKIHPDETFSCPEEPNLSQFQVPLNQHPSNRFTLTSEQFDDYQMISCILPQVKKYHQIKESFLGDVKGLTFLERISMKFLVRRIKKRAVKHLKELLDNPSKRG